jgi:hypothetical protein
MGMSKTPNAKPQTPKPTKTSVLIVRYFGVWSLEFEVDSAESNV